MKFWKMSGAGNDFIMVDNRGGALSAVLSPEAIASLCRRGLSVGADGLIEIMESSGNSFRMRYSNSDGGEAQMCGNGARCICRFACELGMVAMGEMFSFESAAGVHRGLVTGDSEARIWMTEPVLHWPSGRILAGTDLETGFADTGVPHAVVFARNIEDGNFEKFAPLVRSAQEFGPAGANANWVQVQPNGSLLMRTWERGVEGETLACGTGAVASALIASTVYEDVALPVTVRVKSGLELTVGKDSNGWWLQGESRFIYRGETIYL